MNKLYSRALLGLVFLILALGVIIFLSAGSLQFWQGWFYLSTFALSCTVISIYFLKKDPELVERRMNVGPVAEKEKNQKIIQFFAQIFFIAMLIVPGLDHRFNWSNVPLLIVIIANVLVLSGFIIVFLVMHENSYSGSTIEVGKAQRVITTGPYRLVRHPMYFGAGILILFSPIAMGSYWGFICSTLLCVVIVFRLLDEERLLIQNLAGYREYCQHTKYHLIPWVW